MCQHVNTVFVDLDSGFVCFAGLYDTTKTLQKIQFSGLKTVSSVKFLQYQKDQEEEKLFYNLETRLHELESLSEIGKEEIDEKKEEAYLFELIHLGRKAVKKNIKISKKQLVDQKDELDRLRKQLKGNKKKKIALLLTLLEELTNNE